MAKLSPMERKYPELREARKKPPKGPKVTTLAPNQGTAEASGFWDRSVRRDEVVKGSETTAIESGVDLSLPAPPMRLRDLQALGVHLDAAMGMSKVNIAKKWHIPQRMVYRILQVPPENLDVVWEEIQGSMNRLTGSLMHLSRRAMESITEKELKEASLMQKATVIGIMMDKAVMIDKHISGTQDTSHSQGMTQVTSEDRKKVDTEIMELLRKMGVQDAKYEEVQEDLDGGQRGHQEGGERGDDSEGSRCEGVGDDQLDLFSSVDEEREPTSAGEIAEGIFRDVEILARSPTTVLRSKKRERGKGRDRVTLR